MRARVSAWLTADATGQRQSTLIEGLYLANLLALPGLAFLALLWIWSHRATLPALARCHLRQAISGSIWAFGMLVGFNGMVLWWLDTEVPATWMFVLLYFLTIHSSLVLFGMFGLSQAMAGKRFRYPVVGVDCGS